MEKIDIERKFAAYKAPTAVAIAKFHDIHLGTLALARTIGAHCPESPEKHHALMMLKQVRMAANESIALDMKNQINEKTDKPGEKRS